MPFSTSCHIHQEIILQAGGRPGKSISGSQGPSEASCVRDHGESDQYMVTEPLRAEDKGTGLDDLKGSLRLSAFPIIFLLCLLYCIKHHSLAVSRGRKKT